MVVMTPPGRQRTGSRTLVVGVGCLAAARFAKARADLTHGRGLQVLNRRLRCGHRELLTGRELRREAESLRLRRRVGKHVRLHPYKGDCKGAEAKVRSERLLGLTTEANALQQDYCCDAESLARF